MAKSKPRKKKQSVEASRKLKAIQNVQSLLSQTIIGSVQIKENAQITKRNGKLLSAPTKAMADAMLHIKFPYKFLLGYVGRKENGTPYCQYEFVTLSHPTLLYSDELSKLIFDDLKHKFKSANHDTRLTSFWVASPNSELADEEFITVFYQLMDKYRVFDNMLTQYEIRTNKQVGRTLHETTYWYRLCEFEELYGD